jgi:peptide/nickel transport system permease protein
MLGFAARRVVSLILVVFTVSAIAFVIFFEIPGGDPAVRLAGRNPTPQNVERITEEYGFNKPFYVQYLRMMKQAFTGKLTSYQNYTNVSDQILRGLPTTLSLVGMAAVIWLVLGGLIGIFAARHAGRWPDFSLTGLALLGLSLPVFWVGLELRYLLTEKNSIFPSGGYVAFFSDPLQWAAHLFLPAFVLALTLMGVYGRVLRSNILDAVGDDHVLSARAQGISERRVFLRHVLRNALIPLVSLFGLDFAAMVAGGSMLIEQIFNLHGVGAYAAEAIGTLDLPVIMGVTLYFSIVVVLLGAVIELVYGRLDPRIQV